MPTSISICARRELVLRGISRLLVLWLGCVAASAGWARDAFVLVSGGGTPLSNNYSQYLQARALTDYLQRSYPAGSVWIFFGNGNNEGSPATLADVHRQVKEGGLLRDTWLPGLLKNNRPARKAEILNALQKEILPAVHDGGTLYLFIGDHGSLARKEPKESVVTLWEMENAAGTDTGWHSNPEEELSVSELRAALAAGLGRGQVVFCMTQCHSGGFHYLGVPRAMQPARTWFQQVPAWADAPPGPPLPLAAGFTAVDEASLAAGCDPDPDPDRWAGYERFVPQALLGVELFSGDRTDAGLPSYAAAHEAAVLVDQTIDKPRSSSEQLLERWATLIEKLATEPSLTAKAKKEVTAYQKAVDTGLAEATDPRFVAKRAQFSRFLSRMSEQNQPAAGLLLKGTCAELEAAIGPKQDSAGDRRNGSGPTERVKTWKESIRPAWQAAVMAGAVGQLSGEALTFEKYLLAQEDKGRDFMFARRQNPLLNELYWHSSYALPAKFDQAKAEAVTRWGGERRQQIADWARASPDAKVREAAEKLFPPRREGARPPAPPRTLAKSIAAERTLFYRRVLAAWAFLLAMKDETALQQLHQVMDLENTPLPAARTGDPEVIASGAYRT